MKYYSFSTYIKCSVYQGVRNVSFSENFAYALNEWSLKTVTTPPKFIWNEISYCIQADIYNKVAATGEVTNGIINCILRSLQKTGKRPIIL